MDWKADVFAGFSKETQNASSKTRTPAERHDFLPPLQKISWSVHISLRRQQSTRCRCHWCKLPTDGMSLPRASNSIVSGKNERALPVFNRRRENTRACCGARRRESMPTGTQRSESTLASKGNSHAVYFLRLLQVLRRGGGTVQRPRLWFQQHGGLRQLHAVRR